jgi:dihydropyrimidine dehydrogenase (NAD+) subunit PreA
MTSLSVTQSNVKFINPFILASGPPTRNGEMIAKAFDAGWAGAVTKTICLNYESMNNVSPRLWGFSNGYNNIGLKNIELISDKSPQDWVQEIYYLKNNYPDRIIIASISATAYDLKDWQYLAVIMQDAGADILELNLSCPHGLPEKGMGNACCDVPKISAQVTKAVREVSKIPVWVKLSPNVTDIKYLADICLESGADSITAINTVKCFAGVDINTGKPKLDVNGKSAYGGLSGSLIKPIALKAVSEIALLFGCEISAVGGINCWEDAVEFMLLGATTIQLCTKVMFEGIDSLNSLKQGLKNYLETHNYNCLKEITGKSLRYISTFSGLDYIQKVFPVIDHSRCLKCKKCRQVCFDSGYQAVKNLESGFPVINHDKCSSCGLCGIICPVKTIDFKVFSSI